jgi:ribonucleotide reductase beta subunit family protein with ferritin-like domain
MEMMSIQRTTTNQRVGLPAQYGSVNPFPSISESIDLGKGKNFFETRASDFQSAGALRTIDPQTRQTGA